MTHTPTEAEVVGVNLSNPYEGQSYESLRARRKDVMNLRLAYMRETERLMAEARRIGHACGEADREILGVSDHAVLRWLERVEGVDIASIRERIIAAVHESDRVGDAHVVTTSDGVQICINENRVLTVLEARP